VFPRTKGANKGTSLRWRYFSAIGLCSVKMVADKHRYVAYHNKHRQRAF